MIGGRGGGVCGRGERLRGAQERGFFRRIVSRLGVDALGFGGGTSPRRSRRREAAGDEREDRPFGTRGGQRDADAGGPLDHARGDLDELEPQGGELGARPRGGLRHGGAQAMQQPVGGGVEDEAELVCGGALARGAPAGELALVQLDQVLGLAAGTVEPFVEGLGLAGKRGDDEARIEPPDRGLKARHHAALASPDPGGVSERAPDAALVLAGLGAAHAQIVGHGLHMGVQDCVPASPKM